MSVIKLTGTSEKADEGSNYDLDWTFATTPLTLFWRLTDLSDNVQNSRSAVEVSSPSTTLTVKLSGDDLGVTAAEKAATDEDYVTRCCTVYGTYNDGGNTRHFRKEARFPVYFTTTDHDDT